MKKLYYLLFIMIYCNSILSQDISIEWQKNYGGSESDRSPIIRATFDGGFIIGATSSSQDYDLSVNNGMDDYWIVKLDSLGTIEWQKSFGGPWDDICRDIIQTNDSCYIIAGSSVTYIDTIHYWDGNIWIIKLDYNGSFIWQKTFGGSSSDTPMQIIQTSDNNFIIVGGTSSSDGDVTYSHGDTDFWVIKIDTSGQLIWEKTYGGSQNDFAYSVTETNDSNYVICGRTNSCDGDIDNSNGSTDIWIIKIDSARNIIWRKTYGGTYTDIPYSIITNENDEFFLTGYSNSNDHDFSINFGGFDIFVFKLDSLGNKIWQKNYGGNGNESASQIINTSLNEYYVMGYTYSYDNDFLVNKGLCDVVIFSINDNDSLLWYKTYGGSNWDYGNFLCLIRQKEYIIAAYTNSTDGDIINNYGESDIWIMKINQTNNIQQQNIQKNIQIFPNPSAGKFTIKFTSPAFHINNINIFNTVGYCIYSFKSSDPEVKIDIGNKSKGIYYLQIVGSYGIEYYKIIIY
ncbi:MAG: T9SS type A sorting domain-containing protein [Bacteroidia bacterium]|nr:T9SS type A sorting domain-containing protein [Bacteroidia bacterium]